MATFAENRKASRRCGADKREGPPERPGGPGKVNVTYNRPSSLHTVRVRSRLTAGRLQVVVEDDGVGIPEARLARMFEQGIGVNNVNERLKVLFGDGYKMWVDSRPGEGTSTGIEIPEQVGGTVVGVESLAGSAFERS